MADPIPPIDYSSRDWVSIRADLINAKKNRIPEWTSESPNDFGIVLIELFAYMGDMLSFYTDRVANEAYLGTAVLRSSVLAHAKMLDYRPAGLGAATLTMQFTTTGPATIPLGTQVQTAAAVGEAPIIFETQADLLATGAGLWSVGAIQGTTISNEIVGSSDGTLDQTYALFRSPVIDNSPTVTVDEGAGGLQWAFYDHLIDAGPDTAAYTFFVDEGGITNIVFGDDVNGRIPAAGALITVSYRIGDGAKGNVGVGSVNQLTTPVVVGGTVQPVTGQANTTAGAGGSDLESLDSIRQNAPKALTAINRAVTLDDYEALALRASGSVGKASASAAVATAVTLYLAPTGSSAGYVSAAVKAAVQSYLANRKMIGTAVTILDPTYVPVNVSVDLVVRSTYRRETVRLAVVAAIQTALAYSAADFGTRVTLARIYQAINDTEGVAYGNVTLLSTTTTGLADVQTTAAQIPVAGTVTVNAVSGGII